MGKKNKLFNKNKCSMGMLTLVLMGMTACANTHKAVDPKSTVLPQKIYKEKSGKINDGGIWPGDTAKNLLF